MRILLLGKRGQLGWELQRTLPYLGEVVALSRAEADLAQTDSLRDVLNGLAWDALVNAAAYTAVDRAETEADIARQVNSDAPRIMAEEAKKRNALFLHFSTDYVFDGLKSEPYCETDTPNPSGIYARTKLEGERAIQNTGGLNFTFRTSWVYSMTHKDNFVAKVIQWASRQNELRSVTDQTACPTWARALAELTSLALFRMMQMGGSWTSEHCGVYHLASADFVNRYELTRYIVQRLNLPVTVKPALTQEFPSPVSRPAFSALSSTRFAQIFNLRVPSWREMLDSALDASS